MGVQWARSAVVEYQEHAAAVNVSTSPNVRYGYDETLVAGESLPRLASRVAHLSERPHASIYLWRIWQPPTP